MRAAVPQRKKRHDLFIHTGLLVDMCARTGVCAKTVFQYFRPKDSSMIRHFLPLSSSVSSLFPFAGNQTNSWWFGHAGVDGNPPRFVFAQVEFLESEKVINKHFRAVFLVSQSHSWQPGIKNPYRGVVVWPVPENIEITVTLFKVRCWDMYGPWTRHPGFVLSLASCKPQFQFWLNIYSAQLLQFGSFRSEALWWTII